MSDVYLSDRPDWFYLLREFYELYRASSAAGSDKIRAHQRAAREAINRVIKADPLLVFEQPETKPVTAHLRRALGQGMLERHASLVDAISAVAPSLAWRFGYERVPKGLERSYAFAEFASPTAPIRTNELKLGVVLFAPGCTYPAHAHEDITESYVCLSGAVSENHQGIYAPGSLIFNPPGHLHRITVSDREPALLSYVWTGAPAALEGHELKFTRR